MEKKLGECLTKVKSSMFMGQFRHRRDCPGLSAFFVPLPFILPIAFVA